MSNYNRLWEAINEYVKAEVGAGRIVDANKAAISLSSQYPQSGVAIDEIARIIEDAAVRENGALYTGSRPSLGT